jgi:signal transduction histidine kinase
VTGPTREDRVRGGVDAMRIGAILLSVGVTIVAVPATIALVSQRDVSPWWFSVPVTLLLACGVALAGAAAASWARTTRLAARVHVGTVLAATLLLPAVAEDVYDELTPPWVHAYLPSAVAACVLLTRHWTANLVAGAALVVADLRVHRHVWDVPLERILTDVVFDASVLTMGAAVLSSIAHAQRELEREAAATTERFLLARTTEQLGRRGAQWDALVHDEILAALETIALAPPDVDPRALARTAIEGFGEGPPAGDVDHVGFRAAVLETVLTEYPTASTRCSAAADARVLPPDVAEALLTALTEALRNAAAHAYPSGRGDGPVAVRLDHDRDGVSLEVADDGRGFDRGRVGPTSFGVALSIEGRVGAAGGVATVTSRPGAGTTVRVRWPVGGPA